MDDRFKCLLTQCCHYRYALDVNTERAEDVLTHKRLLEEAGTPESSLAFYVRPVHVGLWMLFPSLSTEDSP